MIWRTQTGILYNCTCPATSGLVSRIVASSSRVTDIIFMTVIKFRLSKETSLSTRGKNPTGRLVSSVTGGALVVGVGAAGCGGSGATTSVCNPWQAASWRRRLKPHPSRPNRPMTCPQHPHRGRFMASAAEAPPLQAEQAHDLSAASAPHALAAKAHHGCQRHRSKRREVYVNHTASQLRVTRLQMECRK